MREPIRVMPAVGLPGVTIIDGHWAVAPPPHCMFADHVIRVQHSGTVDLLYRGERHRAGPGVYTISPGEMLVHEAPVVLPLTSHAVVIEPSRFAALVAPAGVVDTSGFRTFRVNGPAGAIAAAVADLVAAVEAGWPAPMQEATLQTLADRVAGCCGKPINVPVRHPAFARLHDHLLRNQARNITLAELAELAQLGRYQVQRLFRSEVGVPPHAYLVQLRVARARRLISRGMAPAEVATAVGFADQSHLGRHFRSIAARTPAAYLGRRGVSALAARGQTQRDELAVDLDPVERPGRVEGQGRRKQVVGDACGDHPVQA
ncbi:MAG: helix-turn-helix transcriptional regulator [Pseudonocardia sp.]|nr:helix-turn-helix transcriptional regulator [Pseudonocardia sp.]